MRTLLVDDSLPFLCFVREVLTRNWDVHVVGDASDGLEALRKAATLQPDLILLDIGLPKLNGIEVAKRIAELSPKAKVIFLTTESSASVAEAALSWGDAYVLKADAATDLFTAIEAVLHGDQFISNRLAARVRITAKSSLELVPTR